MTLYRTCFNVILSSFEGIRFKHIINSKTMNYIKREVRSFNIYCMRYPTLAYKLALASNWHRSPVLSLLFFPLFVRKGKLLLTSISVQAIYKILSDPTFFTLAERQKVTVISFRRLDGNEGRNLHLIVRFLRLLPKLKIVSLNFLVHDRVLQAIAHYCPELTIIDCRLRKSRESLQPHSPFDDSIGTGNGKDILFFRPYDPKIQDCFTIRDFREQIEKPVASISRYIFPAFAEFRVDRGHCRMFMKRIDINFPLYLRLVVKHEHPDQHPVYEETFNLSNSRPSSCQANYDPFDTVNGLVYFTRRQDNIPVPVAVTSSSLQSLWNLKNLQSIFFNDVRRNELEKLQTGFERRGIWNLLKNLPRLKTLECNQYVLSEVLRLDKTTIYSNLSSISVPNRECLYAASKKCPNISRLSILKFQDYPTDPKLGEKFTDLAGLRIEWIEGPVINIGLGEKLGINLSSLEVTRKSFTAKDIETIGSFCTNLRLLSLQDFCNDKNKFAPLLEGSIPVYEKGPPPFPNLRFLYYKLTDSRGLSLFLNEKSNLKSLFLSFRKMLSFCSLMDFIFNKFQASTLLPNLEMLYITPKFVCTAVLLEQLIRLLPELKYLHSEIDDVREVESFVLRENLSVEMVNIFDEFRSEALHLDCGFF